MKVVDIVRPNKPMNFEVNVPASKSISNRLLLLRELCKGNFLINNLSDAGDTCLMEKLLRQAQSEKVFDAENSGTVFRFLVALFAISKGERMLTGSERMKDRPIGPLVNALRQMGAKIEYLEKEGFPPLKIYGGQIEGGKVSVDSSVSSQFVSSLIMIGTVLPKGLIIELIGKPVSEPYIQMTLFLIRQLGIEASSSGNTISVPFQPFKPKTLSVEADWSSASYVYLLAALSQNCDIRIKRLSANSCQGDAIVAELFNRLGVKTHEFSDGVQLTKIDLVREKFEFDFTNFPDLVPAVAIACAGLGIESRLTGLSHLRVKETDRLLALSTELRKTGVYVNVEADELVISGAIDNSLQNISFVTYGDHRMAMAFAALAMVFEKVAINDPDIVVKSWRTFWDELQYAGFSLKYH